MSSLQTITITAAVINNPVLEPRVETICDRLQDKYEFAYRYGMPAIKIIYLEASNSIEVSFKTDLLRTIYIKTLADVRHDLIGAGLTVQPYKLA